MSRIEYRPNIRYLTKINATLDEYIRHSKNRKKQIPPVISDSFQYTPVQALHSLHTAHVKTADLITNITDVLRSKVAKGPSIDEYIKAREENDVQTIAAFEDFHAQEVDGLTEAEVLPVLYEMQDETKALYDFTNEHFFQNQASIEEIDALYQEEEEYLNSIIRNYDQPHIDLDQIAEDNYLKKYLQSKANMATDLIDQIRLSIDQTANEAYRGSIQQMVSSIAHAPELIDRIQGTNQTRFKRHAVKSKDARDRMKRLLNVPMRLNILNRTRDLQNRKMQNREILEWIEKEEVREGDPVRHFYKDILSGVNIDNQETDQLVTDLLRSIHLEQRQYDDYINSISEKKAARSVKDLLSTMNEEFDFTQDDLEKQINHFIHYKKLNKNRLIDAPSD